MCSARGSCCPSSLPFLCPQCRCHLLEINIFWSLKYILACGNRVSNQRPDGRNQRITGCGESSKHLQITETKVNAGPFLNLILTVDHGRYKQATDTVKCLAPTSLAGHPVCESGYQDTGGQDTLNSLSPRLDTLFLTQVIGMQVEEKEKGLFF